MPTAAEGAGAARPVEGNPVGKHWDVVHERSGPPLVEHLDIWTGAIERKNGAGRGNGGKLSLVGIEKLRNLIFDLAVRGKLVPRNPADEPASELIPKIEAAARILIAKKKSGYCRL